LDFKVDDFYSGCLLKPRNVAGSLKFFGKKGVSAEAALKILSVSIFLTFQAAPMPVRVMISPVSLRLSKACKTGCFYWHNHCFPRLWNRFFYSARGNL